MADQNDTKHVFVSGGTGPTKCIYCEESAMSIAAAYPCKGAKV